MMNDYGINSVLVSSSIQRSWHNFGTKNRFFFQYSSIERPNPPIECLIYYSCDTYYLTYWAILFGENLNLLLAIRSVDRNFSSFHEIDLFTIVRKRNINYIQSTPTIFSASTVCNFNVRWEFPFSTNSSSAMKNWTNCKKPKKTKLLHFATFHIVELLLSTKWTTQFSIRVHSPFYPATFFLHFQLPCCNNWNCFVVGAAAATAKGLRIALFAASGWNEATISILFLEFLMA